jgi:hypothetical protein
MKRLRDTWPLFVANDETGAIRTRARATTNSPFGRLIFENAFMTSLLGFQVHRTSKRECVRMVLQLAVFSNSGGVKNVLIVMNPRKPEKKLSRREISGSDTRMLLGSVGRADGITSPSFLGVSSSFVPECELRRSRIA